MSNPSNQASHVSIVHNVSNHGWDLKYVFLFERICKANYELKAYDWSSHPFHAIMQAQGYDKT